MSASKRDTLDLGPRNFPTFDRLSLPVTGISTLQPSPSLIPNDRSGRKATSRNRAHADPLVVQCGRCGSGTAITAASRLADSDGENLLNVCFVFARPAAVRPNRTRKPCKAAHQKTRKRPFAVPSTFAQPQTVDAKSISECASRLDTPTCIYWLFSSRFFRTGSVPVRIGDRMGAGEAAGLAL